MSKHFKSFILTRKQMQPNKFSDFKTVDKLSYLPYYPFSLNYEHVLFTKLLF